MFKNSPSICYIFFAIDNVIVTSVNTIDIVLNIALIKKNDNTGTVRTMRCGPLPNASNNSTCVVIFYQHFQSTKTPVFARKHLSNCFAPYFLFSHKDLIKYLSSVHPHLIFGSLGQHLHTIETAASIPMKFCTVIKPPNTLRGLSKLAHDK